MTVAKDVGRNKRKRIVLSPYINPQYRAVTRTYHQWGGLEFVGDDQPYTTSELIDLIDDNTAMVAVGYPNYLGHIENLSLFAEKAHEKGALLVVVANPMALAMLKSPGELGADIVVGEGQPLGIPLSFGGPYLGYFAVREEYVRRIAGRIVGETVDQDGTRAFVMTLRPREQDIRREKASSNICTNQGLMALAATIYLSLMGKNGLRKAAELCYHKTQYAADRIDDLLHFSVDRSQPFFNEFIVKCPVPVSEINALLSERGILGGVDLGEDYPHLKDHMLLCVTEMNRKVEIDTLVEVLKEVRHE
ncbi:MAG: glycine dehydrogenase (decarboxylating) subunit 1 [Chloroflexi bacterium OLB15]|nr:MAG: glycine dehydrogenase (decarboxylating) subunit 1 [Chloroflexi bacterium OLB15]